MRCKDNSDDVRCYSWMARATTTLTATSFKQKILTVSSYYTKRGVKNGLQFLIKPFITSTFFPPLLAREIDMVGGGRMESVYRQILK